MQQEQLILKERPNGLPDDNTFEYKNIDIFEAGQGEILVKTLYLSVDPYMRGRMSDAPSYSAPFEVGKALYGSTVSEVVQSNSNEFSKGDLVTGTTNFQEYNVVKPSEVRKVQTDHLKPSNALSVLGMPALTAYFGMMHIGEPKKGETVVVSGAAGAVGQVAGQLAKSVGARVVGIVGSEKKAQYITETLGYDAAVEYKKGNVSEQLQETCPDGIDVYYENVGGEISEAVWPLLNVFARIPVCGAISSYNLKEGEEDIGLRVQRFLINSRAKMQGLLVADFADSFDEAYEALEKKVANGELKFEETIYDGFHQTPDAFLGLFSGENIGKQIVKIADKE
ncbi:NADP-dependent oxidoreductase [Tetragenococcus halophilus]|uniref:Putative oxidoreductase n=1 Tax=Tetragenococcus halophilus subsp. halophilus TaxID=1513897 RepID=A0A2H6CUB7_TETHA|nr:NADP-dependent oxidoreductase [Tetragenococcus halophilus]MCO8294274.1 NADP-dependent oxidoreductase [Tetragenococcus halophilus]MCT8309580.1 NADP-dependent oxidoreductase [Tetragenococcus halophilus]GBD68591.1 putative oxidoreductase [Tetragenococcus halophilus subsp. halophilus]GMG71337.1 NADP-dependent oxidoreductase [Tetragenococcus halophilus]GMQ73603.1 NADP-dependent oxidoreductase [Tetragenococcus halophilus]